MCAPSPQPTLLTSPLLTSSQAPPPSLYCPLPTQSGQGLGLCLSVLPMSRPHIREAAAPPASSEPCALRAPRSASCGGRLRTKCTRIARHTPAKKLVLPSHSWHHDVAFKTDAPHARLMRMVVLSRVLPGRSPRALPRTSNPPENPYPPPCAMSLLGLSHNSFAWRAAVSAEPALSASPCFSPHRQTPSSPSPSSATWRLGPWASSTAPWWIERETERDSLRGEVGFFGDQFPRSPGI